MKTGKIYGIEYSIDSSGAIPVKCYNGIIWKLNGQWHRIDGPARINNDGYQAWYQFDQCHREDGPAVEYISGNKVWYYRGKHLGHSYDGYSQENFEQYIYLQKHPELKSFQ